MRLTVFPGATEKLLSWPILIVGVGFYAPRKTHGGTRRQGRAIAVAKVGLLGDKHPRLRLGKKACPDVLGIWNSRNEAVSIMAPFKRICSG